ncbi:hypothetical protein Tco_0654834 [Tanacetum coccineum]|uniref:Uncharacterized protein n=1 Tax=Tanacetum coccineum TaxID=301880 RepID=A0ABQ4X4Y1_9ASTR
MDDSNITIEEYIRLEEEKAQKRRKVFNWETAKYGKIWYDKDILDLRSVETEFPTIVFNDNLTSNETPSCEPMVSSLNDNEIDFRISFDEFDNEDYTNEFPAIIYNEALTSKSDFSTEPTLCPQCINKFDLKDETSLSEYDKEEQNVLYFNDLFPFNIIYPDDQKSDKDNNDNEIDTIQSLGEAKRSPYGVSIYEYALSTLRTKCLKFYKLCTVLANFANMALLPRDQRHQYLRYEGLQYTDADIMDFEKRLAKIYKKEVHRVQVLCASLHLLRIGISHVHNPGWRKFILALGFHTAEEMETVGFGAYWVESARQILDKGDLRDYWIGISSAGDFLGTTLSYTSIRDLILRLCHRLIACSIAARRRKQGAMISRGQFVARLAEHFGLVTEEMLQGLTVILRELLVIDMAELLDAAAGDPGTAEDAPTVDEGDQAILAPVQAPQPPPSARTMPQRMANLKEDMHDICRALAEQREVIVVMAKDFSRFTVWEARGITQLLDSTGASYTPYSETHIPYQRRVRRMTNGASTSAA